MTIEHVPVAVVDVLTPELRARLAITYAETAKTHEGDYRAVQAVAELAVAKAAEAFGVALRADPDGEGGA
jgi:hypothetical protein